MHVLGFTDCRQQRMNRGVDKGSYKIRWVEKTTCGSRGWYIPLSTAVAGVHDFGDDHTRPREAYRLVNKTALGKWKVGHLRSSPADTAACWAKILDLHVQVRGEWTVAAVGIRDEQPTPRISPFPLDPSTWWWVLVLNPAPPFSGCATLFLCHLPSQLPMKSIGAANRGGSG